MPVRSPTPEVIDRYVRSGVWLERPFHRLVEEQALRDAGKLAIRVGSRSLTYGELVSASQGLAGWLLGQGLESEDVVALQAPNSDNKVVRLNVLVQGQDVVSWSIDGVQRASAGKRPSAPAGGVARCRWRFFRQRG